MALAPATNSTIRGLIATFLMSTVCFCAPAALGMPHEPVGEQTFTSPQSEPIALSPDSAWLYVANTTSGTVDVIDTASKSVVATVPVGLEPVSVAVRPDGLEVWVSNHVSDSVSIIDVAAGSPRRFTVVDTVQSMRPDLVTTFDEPVGIAFASSDKAYVALSSRNQVAVVDVASRTVTKLLDITAQDPRALTVAGGRLYVASFESNNQTAVSACPLSNIPFVGGFGQLPPEACTLSILDLVNFVTNPNLPGREKNIVVDPELPDRDVFVFDAESDELLAVVEGVGTLLYGMAADDTGRVWVTNTDALNAVNGLEGQRLVDLENRMFDNRITTIDCETRTETTGRLWWRRTVEVFECGTDRIEDLDFVDTPASKALATPYGVALSGDGSTLAVTAAGTSRLFTVNAESGGVLGVTDLGAGAAFGQQIPRGVALRSSGSGAPDEAYVLNTLENTVAIVDLSDPESPVMVDKIGVGNDPTDDDVRRGRIAFNNAFASDSGNFACASCHPDGNTDQLLWRIGGACFFETSLATDPLGSIVLGACSELEEPRTTMPIRGLRNTIPLHWDGILGDPFGGPNGEVGVNGDGGVSCDLDDEDYDLDCFRDLVDASLSGVMCDVEGGCGVGPSGQPGRLSEEERQLMAFFLGSVSYPPARSRQVDDSLTPAAKRGFEDFFVDKGSLIGPAAQDAFGLGDAKSCGQGGCHSLPLMASTNSPVIGAFDAPTLRGLTDRYVHFSLGITAARGTLEFAGEERLPLIRSILEGIIGFDLFTAPEGARWDPEVGYDERTTLAAVFTAFQPAYNVGPMDIFEMTEEASTGYSGALARQVALNPRTTNGVNSGQTIALLSALEAADAKGLVNLRVEGTYAQGGSTTPFLLSYRENGRYETDGVSITSSQLRAQAANGALVATATAALRENIQSYDLDQPLIYPDLDEEAQPLLPVLPADNPMQMNAVDVVAGSTIIVDGEQVGGDIQCVGGSFAPFCDSGRVTLTLDSVPSGAGLHVVQVVSPGGLMSNEVPFFIGNP